MVNQSLAIVNEIPPLVVNGNQSCVELPCIPAGTYLDIAILVDVSAALTNDYVQKVTQFTNTFTFSIQDQTISQHLGRRLFDWRR